MQVRYDAEVCRTNNRLTALITPMSSSIEGLWPADLVKAPSSSTVMTPVQNGV